MTDMTDATGETSAQGYPAVRKLLHWVVALCVILTLIGGLMLWKYGFMGLKDNFGIETTNLVYKYHKSFGLLILILMTVRIIAKLMMPDPPHVPPLSAFHRIASKSVHGLLYLLLLAQPVVGWVATSAGGFPAEFFGGAFPDLVGKDKALSEALYGVHGALGWLIILLVAIHIGAALLHRFVYKDGVMARMLP